MPSHFEIPGYKGPQISVQQDPEDLKVQVQVGKGLFGSGIGAKKFTFRGVGPMDEGARKLAERNIGTLHYSHGHLSSSSGGLVRRNSGHEGLMKQALIDAKNGRSTSFIAHGYLFTGGR